jgi:tetratricopeptide (TPR) repeat protein
MTRDIKVAAMAEINDLCAESRHLRKSGQTTEAKAAMLSALQIFNSTPDLDELNLAVILDELGNDCFCRGEYAEAELHYHQTIAFLEQVFDPQHMCVSLVLDHLARLFIMQERYDEAELLCLRSLAIKQASLLLADKDTLECMRMTAIVKICLGKFDEAEKLLKKAIDVLEPSTIGPFEEFLRLLARVYDGKGQKDEAERCFKKAVEMFRTRQGQQSGLAQCERDYARLLDKQNRHVEADSARRVAAVAESYRQRADDLPENEVYQPLSYPVTIFH